MKTENIEELQSVVYTKKPFIRGACFKTLPSRGYTCKVLLSIIFFLANTIFLFSLLDFNSKAYSLLLTLVCLATHFTILIMSKTFRPLNTAILTFMYLFMFLAPIAQLSGGELPNTYVPKTGEVELTNFYIFLFYAIFIMVSNLKKNKESKILNELNDISYSGFKLYAFISIFILIGAVAKFGMHVGVDTDDGKSLGLIMSRIVFFTPVFLFAYLVCMKEKVPSKSYKLMLFLSFVLCVIMKNPTTERRNTLGPIYLSILIIVFAGYLMKSNLRFLIFNFFIMGFMFPVAKILTHPNVTFEDNFKFILLDNLRELDYDAWSNFVASIEYTTKVGFTKGQQLLATLFFFVPRNMWATKPDYTGKLIGEYLEKHYNMWFYNLSFPLPAEGFIDFGVIGIIAFAVILGLSVRWLESGIKEFGYNRYIVLYMSFISYFVIRGSLMSTFAYLVGAIIVLITLPLLANKVVSAIKTYRIKASEIQKLG